MEQAGFERAAGRICDSGAILATTFRRGLRFLRKRQDSNPWRVGTLLLPFGTVYDRSGCRRRRGISEPERVERRRSTALCKGSEQRQCETAAGFTRRGGWEGRSAAEHRQL